jgi:hypothetical protein
MIDDHTMVVEVDTVEVVVVDTGVVVVTVSPSILPNGTKLINRPTIPA